VSLLGEAAVDITASSAGESIPEWATYVAASQRLAVSVADHARGLKRPRS
jgi:hypothetical protein